MADLTARAETPTGHDIAHDPQFAVKLYHDTWGTGARVPLVPEPERVQAALTACSGNDRQACAQNLDVLKNTLAALDGGRPMMRMDLLGQANASTRFGVDLMVRRGEIAAGGPIYNGSLDVNARRTAEQSNLINLRYQLALGMHNAMGGRNTDSIALMHDALRLQETFDTQQKLTPANARQVALRSTLDQLRQ